MIHNYKIVLLIIFAIMALGSLILEVVKGGGCGIVGTGIFLALIAFLLISIELEVVGYLIIIFLWLAAGLVGLFEKDVGVFGAIILWSIGGMFLCIYIQGCSNRIMPDWENMVRTTNIDGTTSWADPAMRCNKIDTCKTYFVTRDSIPTRLSICTQCGHRWERHYTPSELLTLDEYQREVDQDYREWLWRYPTISDL